MSDRIQLVDATGLAMVDTPENRLLPGAELWHMKSNGGVSKRFLADPALAAWRVHRQRDVRKWARDMEARVDNFGEITLAAVNDSRCYNHSGSTPLVVPGMQYYFAATLTLSSGTGVGIQLVAENQGTWETVFSGATLTEVGTRFETPVNTTVDGTTGLVFNIRNPPDSNDGEQVFMCHNPRLYILAP